jgi:hypothetical protein
MPSLGLGPAPNPGLVADLAPDRWACDPIDAAFFEKFLTLAASKQIPIFWLIPPLSPEVRARRAFLHSEEAYTRFVRAAIERHRDVVVLDTRGSGYENSLYIDMIHLDRRGAKVLTGDLAAIMLNRLEKSAQAPRWVEMPPFADRANGEELNRQDAKIAERLKR